MKQFKFIDEVCRCGLDLTTLHPERTRDEGAGVCPDCGRTLLVTEVGEPSLPTEPEPTAPATEPSEEPTAEPTEPAQPTEPSEPTESEPTEPED